MITLAAASLSFDGFGDIDFQKTFELAPEAGFRHLELNCWYPRTITRAAVRSIRSRCSDAGLDTVSLHFTGPSGVDHKDRLKDVALAMRGIDMAHELGCSVFCTLGAPRALEGSTKALMGLLEFIVPHAEEAGITIALENHDGHALQTVEDYRPILTGFESPQLGVCADVGHFHASGIPNEAVVDALGDEIVHIHLKDNHALGRKKFVAFGEGTADNAGFVRAMVARGYSGLAVVELSPGSLDFGDRDAHLAALKTGRAMFSEFEKE